MTERNKKQLKTQKPMKHTINILDYIYYDCFKEKYITC